MIVVCNEYNARYADRNATDHIILSGLHACEMQAPRVPLDQASAEVCPACQAKFGTIAELIQHVDVYHADRHAPAASGLERCPHCSQAFTDAVALVQHVEQDHSSSRACVLC